MFYIFSNKYSISYTIYQPFDFRLPNVLSMSSSGHKFGESICGTGWIVFRHKEDSSEHIAVEVTYLGGKSESMTLNFSRPASGPYVQYYKLLRLGRQGYKQKVENQMAVAKYLRDFLKAQVHKPSGKPRFQMLDGGDTACLPVVAARINPEVSILLWLVANIISSLTNFTNQLLFNESSTIAQPAL